MFITDFDHFASLAARYLSTTTFPVAYKLSTEQLYGNIPKVNHCACSYGIALGGI